MPAGPVLIAYDGSDTAEHALREAAAVLQQRRALVVSVWEEEQGPVSTFGSSPSVAMGGMPMPPVSPPDEIDKAMMEMPNRTAKHGAEIARQVGFEAEALAVEGEVSVAETILGLAAERDAVAIVVGDRGLGRVAELLGSTSREVIRHSTCPVLVVRMQAEQD